MQIYALSVIAIPVFADVETHKLRKSLFSRRICAWLVIHQRTVNGFIQPLFLEQYLPVEIRLWVQRWSNPDILPFRVKFEPLASLQLCIIPLMGGIENLQIWPCNRQKYSITCVQSLQWSLIGGIVPWNNSKASKSLEYTIVTITQPVSSKPIS